ncbi:antibiotic biosynthesis monooxygenase family protein [Streptomyces marispadix]|uniref:Antibiotic biosynthesis monooxygenase n=1 Tax=Streptomyces marispadix TaxID=2922868 RepID=A0ABS9SUY0_9ACTN|nr:antibiotic biosynthesis monooxygenase [Streptomyces marispadix]MCH6160077.1 antibiotic biosynthesis monooxygenase [Streptomyces marispadix]
MSVVKINVLNVPAEQRETLEKRFASRAGAVEGSDGFEWFELLRPVEGTDDYLVYTRWRDEESYQAWMEGTMKSSHQGSDRQGTDQQGSGQQDTGDRPKPVSRSAAVWSFEVVQQAAPKDA